MMRKIKCGREREKMKMKMKSIVFLATDPLYKGTKLGVG
jgi:hypothetical protein